MIKYVVVAFILLIVILGLFLFYGAGHAVKASTLPTYSILHFDFPDPELQLQAASAKKIKLVTYNIGYASGDKNNEGAILKSEEVKKNLENIASSLQNLNADIIGLQEIDFYASRTFDVNQLQYLGRALEMPYAAYVVYWNVNYLPWPYWPPSRQFGRIVAGQALLSRFPIKSQEVTFFEKPAGNSFWYNWFYLDRVAQHIILSVGDKQVSIWHTHLEAFDGKARREQITRLAHMVKEDNHPLKWVIGDFNSVSAFRKDLSDNKKKELEDKGEGVEIFDQITGLKNAESSEPFYSMPSWDPIKKIDHIFYSSSVQLSAAGSEILVASDHLPVWAEFELP